MILQFLLSLFLIQAPDSLSRAKPVQQNISGWQADSLSARKTVECFIRSYESGDKTATLYVYYTGPHVNDMGGTPEELEKELLPAELSKNRKNPAEATLKSLRYEAESKYKEPVFYAEYLSRNKIHSLCLHKIDGNWKVDLSFLWMGDWYDWMPGY